MPKDYQEEIEEISINIISHLAGVLPSGSYDRLENNIIKALTTYGNARELQGVEKVEKGVPARNDAESDSIAFANGFNTARIATLDHIERIKKELT
jgi:hypothetical protein